MEEGVGQEDSSANSRLKGGGGKWFTPNLLPYKNIIHIMANHRVQNE